ncbi:DUF1593 domain-containing protein [Kluyvera georgiana]|uniref:DUF1593 domain-containing protein n=1 Tax=Kluyvera georgiana TaxID=73098 RepID=UPI002302D98C|nr:nucleoside hydrolase-like domain-containing protein [Kluyvera georgiana]MDA8494903.1 DUF1593 domain-containing protein [Kluyvera georgiana]
MLKYSPIVISLASALLLGHACAATTTDTSDSRARTVITTDGEVDDMNSLIRAFLYANDMDIAGIVLTSSVYHYAGDAEKGIKPYRWTGTQWVYNYIADYGKVYDNLKAHDPRYPTPEYLRSITKIGNISNKGDMAQETDGSRFLEKLFLDNDSRTLYVQTWGGTNTTARALKSIEDRYKNSAEWPAIQQKINHKLVLYIILDQDNSYNDYIATHWPNLKTINDRSNFWHFAYAWKYHSDELNSRLKGDWSYHHLVDNKGPLMANYALMGDGKMIDGELYDEQRGTDDYLRKNPQYQKYDFISEGDSPSFLYLIDNGLRSRENPSYGGWGGRFGPAQNNRDINNVLDYNIYTQRYEAQYSLSHWFDDIQNDFAARVNWSTTRDDTAVNHPPKVSVKEGLNIRARPGETVNLTALASDPDGNALSYHWWRYFEADTYQDSEPTTQPVVDNSLGMQLDITRTPDKTEKINTIALQRADTPNMSFVVPQDAKTGDTLHMVVTVRDNGKPVLTRYQRVIITVE